MGKLKLDPGALRIRDLEGDCSLIATSKPGHKPSIYARAHCHHHMVHRPGFRPVDEEVCGARHREAYLWQSKPHRVDVVIGAPVKSASGRSQECCGHSAAAIAPVVGFTQQPFPTPKIRKAILR